MARNEDSNSRNNNVLSLGFDIETGGHIFQGEILPSYMWERRLESKTPMSGVYLCGACTHPGGSVLLLMDATQRWKF